jgi:type I restriction-modification system DNA methylase subunit
MILGTTMGENLAKRIRKAYLRFLKSVVSETSEHDVRSRFIQHFIYGGLGYPEKCCINEKKWADIWLLEREAKRRKIRNKENYRLQSLPVVVIETKPIETENKALPKDENIKQVFRYVAPGATRYVALTNFKRFILWHIRDSLDPQSLRQAVADVDIEAEVTHVSFASQVNKLAPLCFEEISRVYDDFSTSPNIDLGEPENFEAFTKIVKWKILDETLIPQFERLAIFLNQRHSEYEEKRKNLKSIMESINKNNKVGEKNSYWQKTADLERQLRLLEKSYADANRFQDCFAQWQRMAYPPKDSTQTKERIGRIARETAYTQFSRLLLVRIAEDKTFLKQKLSDGGLETALGLITHITEAYKQILKLAFDDASHAYKRLFKEFVYDWYWEGDGELNDSIRKVLWFLNQYDFSKIQGDVFKYVYQFHMDRNERRRIGEYYTPDDVVKYILDKVGYVSSKDLRGFKLLDPGCGSGTFLVEAVNRLKKLKLGLSAKELLFMVAGRPGPSRELGCVFGFDVLPFPVYLTESNLLFLLLNEIQDARKEERMFVLDKFQVYRTDSLEPPSPDRKLDSSIFGLELEEEEISLAKSQKYHFVVGNPPYVEVERLKDRKKGIIDILRAKFPDILKSQGFAIGRLELFIVFMAFAIAWLRQKGKFGFVVSSKFLTTKNGNWLRKLILDTCLVEEIVDLTRVNVFEQSVYPVILVMQRESDSDLRNENMVNIKIVLKDDLGLLEKIKDEECPEFPDYDTHKDFVCYGIPQSIFKKNQANLFDILASQPLRPILAKISDKTYSVPLGKICEIRQGIIRGGEDNWKARLKSRGITEYGDNFTIKGVLSQVPKEERKFFKKFVDGNSIGEFIHEWNKNETWICYDKQWLTAPRVIENYEQEEKMFIPKRGRFLKASLDYDKIYAQDDIYTAYQIENATYKPNIKYVLGLLNSYILDFYYKMIDIKPIRGKWFEYYGYALKVLPIRRTSPSKEKMIISLVDKIIESKFKILEIESNLSSMDAIITKSGAPMCTAGLSRLVKKREGVENQVQSIHRSEKNISFSRDKKVSLECISEDAASLIERIFKDSFQEIRYKTLGHILSEAKLPADDEALRIVRRFEEDLRKSHKQYSKSLDKLKSQLNKKVAHLYELSDDEYVLLRKALSTLSRADL